MPGAGRMLLPRGLRRVFTVCRDISGQTARSRAEAEAHRRASKKGGQAVALSTRHAPNAILPVGDRHTSHGGEVGEAALPPSGACAFL